MYASALSLGAAIFIRVPSTAPIILGNRLVALKFQLIFSISSCSGHLINRLLTFDKALMTLRAACTAVALPTSNLSQTDVKTFCMWPNYKVFI